MAGYGGGAVRLVAASPVPNSVTNCPGEIGFPGGAKLAAFSTPSGFRNTPVPLNDGTCTPKNTSYAPVSELLIVVPTNPLPAAPSPTVDSSDVPVPSAVSAYPLIAVKSSGPNPRILSRLVQV